MRIAILGGGVAGVVLARELAQGTGHSIDLIERNATLGGLHRSLEVGGVHYDIGAFLFDPGHELLKTFPFLFNHFVEVDHRSIVITESHTLDNYPMSLRGYVRDNGVLHVAADAANLLVDKIRYRRRDSLVSFVQYYLGRRVYHRSGLKAYIERFYAALDTDVDLEFALQRLQALPDDCGLRRNLFRIARRAFDTPALSVKWHCYVRPKEGFAFAYSLIESALRSDGVNVRLNLSIENIERHGEAGFTLRFADGQSGRYDVVISTIPVASVMRAIGRPMVRPPETIRLISLCYRFRGDLGFRQANMLYNFTYQGNWKRLNLFSPLYGVDHGDDYFIVECTQRPNDPRTPEDHRRLFERNVRDLPILRGELKYQDALVTDDAYPFFRRNDLRSIAEARRTLNDYGILLTGRQGTFSYTNAHQTALNAKSLARDLIEEPS